MILLVFYIIFLPESERIKILESNETSTVTGTVSTSVSKIILLSEDVGTLTYVKEKELEHTLPSILLEERANAVVLSQVNPFIVRKGWFTATTKDIAFSVEKPSATENVLLSFLVGKHNGYLRVYLNDVNVFDSEVKSDSVQVIGLKKELLKNINTINFKVYGGGILASIYELKDVKIVGDVVDITRKAATVPFIISPEEKTNLLSGYVSFYAVCNRELAGTMTINLNDKILSSAIPSCNSINRIETVGEDFYDGRNVIEFSMPSGKARLDSVLVKTRLKPTKSYINYFNINGTVISKVSARQGKIWLALDFVDDNSRKTADVNINGILSTIDQSTAKYEKDITSKIKEGNNYLAITPRTELNIVGLQVVFE